MRKFDDIQIGETAELYHVVTAKDVDAFASLTGDDNKLHMEDAFAGNTSFGKRVVHGMLSASFISTIIGTKLPGDGALWFNQTMEFLLPVRIGDKIRVTAEVKSKTERTQSIELQTDIYNQHGQVVLAGMAKVKIVEQNKQLDVDTENTTKRTKVALVVGATGGIGYAACMALAAEGFQIGIHYHSNEAKATLLQNELQSIEIKSTVYKADIANAEEVVQMFAQVERKLGSIEVVVNCSIIPIPVVSLSNTSWSNIEDHLNISVKGMFNLFNAAIPGMMKNHYGRIIALSTQAIEMSPPKGWIGYITSKSALVGLCKAMAVEIASFGITVNMVSPGMTETSLISDLPEKARLIAAAKSPVKRLAFPSDIANAIAFFASEDAAYVTGETLRVNGGQIMI
jgi:3-oxoacyl-[acyl-carrier protein] reductase